MTREIRMPILSQSMIQGRVVEWLWKEGDKVSKGAPLVVVESDKAIHELQAPQAGILSKILVTVGTEVAVETPIAIIADAEGQGGEEHETIPSEIPQVVVAGGPASAPVTKRKPVSPVARRVAQDLNVDVAQVLGTGPNGLVTEKDVHAFAERATVKTSSDIDDDHVIPLIGQRGRIAERMALSRRTAADVTTVMDVDMEWVAAHRTTTGFSYTAYVIWATAQALCEFPMLNAWMMEDRIIIKRAVHVGVAAATAGALLVPVLRNADQKTLAEIDQEIDVLGTRARAGQLTPDDMKGSTFTVTNSGVFGSLLFTPIINLPEVAILGMGKVAETPVVRRGQIVVAAVMYLCLSYDHRAVDGASAVQFLQAVKRRLEGLE